MNFVFETEPKMPHSPVKKTDEVICSLSNKRQLKYIRYK